MLLPPVPEFANGAILSASADLNVLTVNQAFAYEASKWINWPYEEVDEYEDHRWLLHRYRYLHWSVGAPTSAHLFLDSHDLGAVAGGSTSGYIDLQHAQDLPAGANPYSLTLYRPYQLQFDNTVTRAKFYESRNTASTFALPTGTPSFTNGQTASATQLNQIADNTEYLVYHGAHLPYSGFTARRYTLKGVGGSYNERLIRWRFRHRGRYLHFKGSVTPNGADGDEDTDFYMQFNGTTFFFDEIEFDQNKPYHFIFDLEGTDHDNVAGNGAFITLSSPPSVGDEYTITLVCNNPSYWATTGYMTTVFLCEGYYRGVV